MIILSLARPFFERRSSMVFCGVCLTRRAKAARYYRDDDFQELLATAIDCPCGITCSTDARGVRVSLVLSSDPEKIFLDEVAAPPIG
jgi:hypothetical protein